jgi:hypothetical protein
LDVGILHEKTLKVENFMTVQRERIEASNSREQFYAALQSVKENKEEKKE